MSPKSENVYKRFTDYSRYTPDPYWKRVFVAMSNGKFPSGYSLNSRGSTITSEDGRKLKLKSDDDQESIFNNTIAIRTFMDHSPESEEGAKKVFVDDWKAIKSKEAKNHLIASFAKQKIKAIGGTVHQERKLSEQIGLCLQLSTILPTDVIMKDGKIVKIKGVTFKKNGELDMPPVKIPKKSSSNKKKKNPMRQQIEKMIKENQLRLEKLVC